MKLIDIEKIITENGAIIYSRPGKNPGAVSFHSVPGKEEIFRNNVNKKLHLMPNGRYR